MFREDLKKAIKEVKNESKESIRERMREHIGDEADNDDLLERTVEEQQRNCNDALKWFEEFHELCLENPEYALENTGECVGSYCNNGDPFGYTR